MINNKKDFGLYLNARLVGTIGMQMQSVAIGWQMYERTQSPVNLGLVGLVQFLPVLGFSLFSGQLADRIERHRIVWVSHAIMALCCLSLGLLTMLGRFHVGTVYAILFVIGAARAFLAPAAQSFFPQLVRKDALSRAVALNTSVWQFAVIVGPSLGGLIYALFHHAHVVYLASAACLAVSGTSVFLIRARSKHLDAPAGANRDIWAGLQFIRARREILAVTTLDLFAVLLGGATALLPAFAKDVLHAGPTALGILRSAPAAGAAVMGVVLAFRPIRRSIGKSVLLSVAAFGLMTIVFGLSRNILLAWLALFFLGTFDVVSVVTRQSLVQLRTPHEMRGRVSAVNTIFISSSNELGEFESGMTAALWGIVPAIVVGGIGTCLVTLVWAWKFPELRTLDDIAEPVHGA